MRASILFWCVTFTIQAGCLSSSSLSGGDCEKIQEAGEEIGKQVRSFDRLLQVVVMRCFEESELIADSCLKFMKKGIKTYQSTIKKDKTNLCGCSRLKAKTSSSFLNFEESLTPIEKDVNIQLILNAMSTQLDSAFTEGYNKFFELVKKAGGTVIGGDSTVVNALVQYPSQNRRRKRGLNSIDDQIASLRQEMNTSLSEVETHLFGVSKQLYGMLATSLKDLVNSQEYKTDFDKTSARLRVYLRTAIQTAIQSYIDSFYYILKKTAQQIEIIDSIVHDAKRDTAELQDALKPAKTFVDEAIEYLKKNVGLNEMKRQLKLKLKWMQNTFKKIKADELAIS